MPPRTVAIIQARMGSSRLPGKVMLDLGGKPMLQWVVERTRRATQVHQVMVATTDDPADDPIVAFCEAHNIPCYRGSTFDVLDRYYQAARSQLAEIVVRITADCPLIDPGLIDRTLDAFFGRIQKQDKLIGTRPASLPVPTRRFPFDFVANRLPPPFGRTYPIGLDVEVCTFSGLELVWDAAVEPFEREHVMPYFYEQPGRFGVLLVNHTEDLGHLRWTVDTPQDLEFVRQVVARFAGRDDFTWLDVLDLVRREPHLSQINAHVQHKTMTDTDARAANASR